MVSRMARIARVIADGIPHHITQRGNRRQQTFFAPDDYAAYLSHMAEWCKKCRVAVWAYCLMPNHVHLVAVPEVSGGLRRAIGEAHRRYTLMVNARHGWTGHLWQGRFASFPMDEQYLLAAVRYVELNPVRAKLVEEPAAWKWSSAAAHLAGKDDELVRVAPLLHLVDDWRKFLSDENEEECRHIRRHERTGRPLGDAGFLAKLEEALGRIFAKQKPGPRKATGDK